MNSNREPEVHSHRMQYIIHFLPHRKHTSYAL